MPQRRFIASRGEHMNSGRAQHRCIWATDDPLMRDYHDKEWASLNVMAAIRRGPRWPLPHQYFAGQRHRADHTVAELESRGEAIDLAAPTASQNSTVSSLIVIQ
jgi:hypothetical protein